MSLDVPDHFPIEVDLHGQGPVAVASPEHAATACWCPDLRCARAWADHDLLVPTCWACHTATGPHVPADASCTWTPVLPVPAPSPAPSWADPVPERMEVRDVR